MGAEFVMASMITSAFFACLSPTAGGNHLGSLEQWETWSVMSESRGPCSEIAGFGTLLAGANCSSPICGSCSNFKGRKGEAYLISAYLLDKVPKASPKMGKASNRAKVPNNKAFAQWTPNSNSKVRHNHKINTHQLDSLTRCGLFPDAVFVLDRPGTRPSQFETQHTIGLRCREPC